MEGSVVCVVDVRNGRRELVWTVWRDAEGTRRPIERWKCPNGVWRGSSHSWVVRVSWTNKLPGVGESWRLLVRDAASWWMLLLLYGNVLLPLRIWSPWRGLLGRLALAEWRRRVLVERGAEAVG